MSTYLKGMQTDRLILRELTKLDSPVWAQFFLDTNSFAYIGLSDDKSPCEHSDEWLERQFKRYREGDYGLLAMIEKDNMKFVGQCGLITMNVQNDRELEIGYHIIEEFRGNGYATEAALAIRDFVFENDLADSVITVINKKNTISMKVTEKLGFKQEDEILCMNKPSYLYRMSRGTWEKIKK